jgi:hypothetical protein
MSTPTTLSGENPDMKTSRVVNRKRKLIWIGVFAVGLLSFGCLCIAVLVLLVSNGTLNAPTSSITIDDAFMTTGLDAQRQPFPATTLFSSGQAKIYCFVTITASQPIPIGVRWFYQSDLILEQKEMVNGKGAFVIVPPSGKKFQIGEYRVEIYLVKDALRTVYFSVDQ